LTGWRVEGPDNRWNFVVQADNGDIWLEGEVPRYSVIREAINAARQVSGVRSVRSQLELAGC
jgi:osmotically-inducible protein OsmY